MNKIIYYFNIFPNKKHIEKQLLQYYPCHLPRWINIFFKLKKNIQAFVNMFIYIKKN